MGVASVSGRALAEWAGPEFPALVFSGDSIIHLFFRSFQDWD